MKKNTLHFVLFNTQCDLLWQKYPALFLGIALLCGCGLGLDFKPSFLIPLTSLGFLVYSSSNRKKLSFLLLGAAFLGFGMMHLSHALPQEGNTWKGRGLFVINNFQKSSSPFQQCWRYDGEFKWFKANERLNNSFIESPRKFCEKAIDQSFPKKTFRNVPCSIFLPLKKLPPPADHAFILEGVMKCKEKNRFSFKPTIGIPWKRVPHRFSFAHLRYEAKEKIRKHLRNNLRNPSSCDFLSALATGEMENKALSHNFGNLGLQHLLAISGFHFGLIALSLSWFLSLFLSPRLSAMCLLPLITLYFFFIGTAPSCFRAWMTISLFLLSNIFSWRTSSLNLLGTSLIASLLINPFAISSLGFQLSYLITLAILLFYPLFEILFSPLLPPRPFQSLIKMSRLHQHGYILSAFLRAALALNSAVHLLALPTLLFLFGKFPCLSLLYNLFIPFQVGISLFLLIASLLLAPLPFVSTLIHHVNSLYTSWILNLTAHPPTFFQFFLRTGSIPLWALTLYLTLCFWIGMNLKEHFAAEKLTESPF